LVESTAYPVRKNLVLPVEPIKPLPAGVAPVPVTLQFIAEDRLGNKFTKESTGPCNREHKIWLENRQRFDEEAKRSCLFTAVDAVENKQTLNFEITAKSYLSAAGEQATLLSFLTLIPTWPDMHHEITIVATTPCGKTYKYVMEDGVVRINWWPLVIAAPFKPILWDFDAVVENMYRSAFIKMQNDGVLPKDKPFIRPAQ